MRRAFVAYAAVAAAVLVPASAQDFGFVAVQKLAVGVTSRGVVGAIGTTGLLGTAHPVAGGFSATDVSVGDFDGDGETDIVAVGMQDGIGALTLFLGQGDGTFGFPQVVPLAAAPTALAATDLAGVGTGPGLVEAFTEDLLTGGAGIGLAGDGIGAFVSARKGTTVSLPTVSLHGKPLAAAAGFFSGSTPGFAAVLDSGTLVVVPSPGTAAEVQLPLTGPLPEHPRRMIALGVSNLPDPLGAAVDADLDVFVAADGNGLLVLENQLATSNATFTSVGTLANLEGNDIVRIADFNADGFADVATASTRGASIGVTLAISDGPGYAEFPILTSITETPISIDIGRFNDDAFADVVYVATDLSGASVVHILLGDGAGSFTPGPSITSASGVPLGRIRSVATGRIDARSTTDDMVLAVEADDVAGAEGGVVFLSAAEGYDVVPVPIRTKAFHPCLELVAAALEERDEALVGTLTPAQRKQKKAIAKARKAMSRTSANLKADLVMAADVIAALARAFRDDQDLVDLVAEALDCVAEEVRDDRDEVSSALLGLPSSKVRTKVEAALSKADGLIANAGTAQNQAAIAKLLTKALTQVGKGVKTLRKLPSYVVATNDGAPFASDDLDYGAAPGGAMSLFAFDFAPGDRTNWAEINLNLTGIAGPGTYDLAAFPAKNRAYIARNGPACGFNCPRWDATSGTVTITSEAGGFIDGTFSFTAERVSGTGVFTTYVYSGRFHLKY